MSDNTKIVYKSLLWPLYEKYISDPLFEFIPWGLPANMITIFGNLCMFLAVLTAYLANRQLFHLWQIIPLLVLIYLTGDLLDGKQARRTNTSSGLGEFLDHFHDILVMGYVISMLMFAFDIRDTLFIAIIIATGYLSMFGSYYEQYYTNTLYFESISSFETIVFATLLCCIGFLGGTANLLNREIFFHLSTIKIICILTAIFAFILMLRNLCRSRTRGWKLCFLFFPMVIVTVALSTHYFSMVQIMVIITLYCASYVERLMLAHVKNEKSPVPDFVFPIALTLTYFIKAPDSIVIVASIIYQFVSIVMIFLYGFIPLRSGWIWVNPPKLGRGNQHA
jgi:phosphatidylglycerophosphate synthase